jgi:hypothetical protein
MGVELSEKEIQDALLAVKTQALTRKRPLTEAEFKAIIAAIKAKK